MCPADYRGSSPVDYLYVYTVYIVVAFEWNRNFENYIWMMQLVYCIQWMEDSTLRLELHFSLRDVPISKLANIPITNTLSKTTHTVIDTDII